VRGGGVNENNTGGEGRGKSASQPKRKYTRGGRHRDGYFLPPKTGDNTRGRNRSVDPSLRGDAGGGGQRDDTRRGARLGLCKTLFRFKALLYHPFTAIASCKAYPIATLLQDHCAIYPPPLPTG